MSEKRERVIEIGTVPENKSIYELLEEDIMGSDIGEAQKTKQLSRLLAIRQKGESHDCRFYRQRK